MFFLVYGQRRHFSGIPKISDEGREGKSSMKPPYAGTTTLLSRKQIQKKRPPAPSIYTITGFMALRKGLGRTVR